MEFEEVLRRRQMVRSFEDRPVPSEVVDRIVAGGLRAPSAGFSQGSEFLVLQGPEETNRYWDASFSTAADRQRFRRPGLLRAPVLVLVFANEDAYRDRYAEPDKGRPRDRPPWDVPYWFVDAGFSALLMLLGAVDAGLGALFFVVAHPDRVAVAFGVPERFVPVGAVAVGYPAPDRPSPSLIRGRRPPSEVVHRGRW
ncbi:MAG: nitroreductase family protein [Actinomycetota bacterium]|nr:nitroreductase family protein [Actinomycetota bacterium]